MTFGRYSMERKKPLSLMPEVSITAKNSENAKITTPQMSQTRSSIPRESGKLVAFSALKF